MFAGVIRGAPSKRGIMIFVDEARIVVKAGDGGQGCISFYRDKFMRHPIPDGGDGGRGGDVVFVADKGVQTLLDFRFKQHHKGNNGSNASSKNKKGRTGADLMLRVPVGTIIRDHDTKLLISDLVEDKQRVVVALGGKGGRGNNKNRNPSSPEQGEQRKIDLELKLIADVGIVGFPNAGKSTLISNVSKVRSKIANYPFTTKQPILGIVYVDDFSFVMADLPGIIEGAHEGRGLGDKFLRHAERTKVLVHLIDMAGTEGRDPLDDYKKINDELEAYGEKLVYKEKLVVANKMDLPEAKEYLKKFKKKYKSVKILSISAQAREGLDEFLLKVKDILEIHKDD